METTILNYRIIIEKEKQKKGYLYVAYVPSLGVSDFGKTIDEASSNIKKAIQLYVETLIELKKPIPTPDSDDYFVTRFSFIQKILPKERSEVLSNNRD